MKKFAFLTTMATVFLFAVIMLASCTKEGPAGTTGATGPMGSTGTAGLDGEDGINGTDGTAGCIECHDGGVNQGMFSKTIQWEASVHATGGNFNRADGECATCHTSQGFRENLITAAGEADISNPNPINCYTCHQIHESYTPNDLNLTTSAPVVAKMNGAIIDLGKANLCVNCHQGRNLGSTLAIDGDSITVTSGYWSAHYGVQGNIFAGLGAGAFEFSGSESYGENAHKNLITDACITCHMAEANGVAAGGHTWNMGYEQYGSFRMNTAGCVECHTDASDLSASVATLKSDVATLMAELEALLVAQHVVEPGDDHIHAGTYAANTAAAFINFKMINRDRSNGVHNPKYIKALLTNTIEAITP